MDKSNQVSQFVTFQIGDEEYGIDIMLVQEIIRYQKLTKVFNANPAIKGVMNFRGNVIPIIDMRKKFKLPEIEYDDYTVVIIIEINKKTMGMIVDRVSDILSFDAEEIQVVDREFVEDVMTEHLKAMAKKDNRIIMLLDSNRVMSFEEYAKVKQSYTGTDTTDEIAATE
ncbi:chemotaxis protein CheW [Desulfuribacillus alkaliarsenatis]|uniref:chemotaxis protein CheW n=1 Tax=Desulfuribacillus alkaliarsenatis TaxID=766136 RepID=UPI000AA6790F|nr:chemotaxis protein CheW [Desulfuribacillus alkaliarsenatis]